METTKKHTTTNWYPEKKLLVTNISGYLETADVEIWEQSFKETLDQIDDNTRFKIFVNMHGFKAINMDAHKRFRAVIPTTLLEYGWKVGYINLFEEEAQHLHVKYTRGIQCVGAAHAHQDETKMELYESRFSNDQEHYFTDPNQAMQWIETLIINN
jgi:hypothetical protein